MQLKKLPLADTHSFTPFFLDYIEEKPALKPFYSRFPRIDNFKDQIAEKSKTFTPHQRQTLTSVLQRQYQNITASDAVKKNIELLSSPNTFTITTGHQLNIFTGPLYFIYKIVTVINSCKQLKIKYPDHNFVPVYWMASEDHDYEEIKYFRLYGKKYSWKTEQQGAVGRFHTRELQSLLKDIPGDTKIFEEAYSKHNKLSDAVRHYVNALFKAEGLLVIEPDDRDLKSLFKKVMEEDIIRCSTASLVTKTNQQLETLQYKPQVFCRDINFFYLDNQLRSRIEKKGDLYHVLDTDLKFNEAEIRDMIEHSPEKLSPNVILRPLYQEMILPNLAYVGGPAEAIYWLQLKTVFDNYQVPFPMLMPRNFALVIEQHLYRKFEKTDLKIEELFEEKNFIFNHWVVTHSKHNLTVGPERTTINEIFALLKERAEGIDKTLGPFIGAEGKRALNSLEKIERKLLRAEKRLQGDKLRQIESIKDALFPNGSLQERTDNFLNFYQQDPQFIHRLLTNFDPFDFRFNVLIYSPT
jgi:bacillithiol biosynthesis cysteine-adding enzyme BshC